MVQSLCIILVLFAVLNVVNAKYITGHVHTASSWVFVTRFVFTNEQGRLDYTVDYPAASECCPSLVFYYDDQWNKVYPRPDMNCLSKIKYAGASYGITRKQELNSSSSVQCVRYEEEGISFRRCSSEMLFYAVRSQWWFLVLSQCEGNKTSSLDVKYEFTVTNGDSWEKHISGDESHMVETTICFLAVFTIAITIGFVYTIKLSMANLLHRPYKLFLFSLAYEEGALIFEMIYYGNYVISGKQAISLQTTGSLLHAASETMFIVLLLLLAKGFTITRYRLSPVNYLELSIFASAYVVFYIILFVIKTELFDPGLVLNDYDNLAGRAIVTLRLSGWVWFVYASVHTVCRYPEKRVFYCWFCFLFSVWFLSKPSLILWSYVGYQQWQRSKIIKRADLSICAVAYGVFLYLTRPTQTNKNFPFHIRTNQIDVMTHTQATDFPHTEGFCRIGKNQKGILETSLTDLETVGNEDEPRINGISSAWFPRNQ